MYPIAEETLKLKTYLLQLAESHAGQSISFEQIAYDTGIDMDAKGKTRLRNAAKYAGVEYAGVKNYGITLAGAKNGTTIIGGRLARIDSSVRRAEKATKNISRRYLQEMNAEDQKKVVFLGSVFGAIRSASDQYRTMIEKKQNQVRLVNT